MGISEIVQSDIVLNAAEGGHIENLLWPKLVPSYPRGLHCLTNVAMAITYHPSHPLALDC